MKNTDCLLSYSLRYIAYMSGNYLLYCKLDIHLFPLCIDLHKAYIREYIVRIYLTDCR